MTYIGPYQDFTHAKLQSGFGHLKENF